MSAQLLTFAETLAKKRGQRWTETRAQVYETLLGACGPVTAYKLLDDMAQRFDRSVQPMSVYRALEALTALGLIVRIESLGAFVACRHPDHDHQHVFLICDHCGQVDEIADCALSGRLINDAAARGFRALRQILELRGDCGACQAA